MPARKLPPDEVLIKMYLDGLSDGEIAKELGINKNTVAGGLYRLSKKGLLEMRSLSDAIRLGYQKGTRTPPSAWWLGRKQPPEMVEKRISKIRGENHYLWKGALHHRSYRDMIDKEECAKCGSKEQLLIHHINEDHSDNTLENLQVLCSPCHTTLHKTKYWEEVRKGERPPPQNIGRPKV